MQPYTKQEVEYIKEHYPSGNVINIANKLNRSVKALYTKAYSLGIKFNGKRSYKQKKGIGKDRYNFSDLTGKSVLNT